MDLWWILPAAFHTGITRNHTLGVACTRSVNLVAALLFGEMAARWRFINLSVLSLSVGVVGWMMASPKFYRNYSCWHFVQILFLSEYLPGMLTMKQTHTHADRQTQTNKNTNKPEHRTFLELNKHMNYCHTQNKHTTQNARSFFRQNKYECCKTQMNFKQKTQKKKF